MDKSNKTIIAFVGMPGAGKSEAAAFLKKKGVPFIRFGQFTDDEISKRGLDLNPKNERMVREEFREKLGMAAYAIMAKPAIEELLKTHQVVALDGLYSWEEYIMLKNELPSLILIHIYAEPTKRYDRLSTRPVRPLTLIESRKRDILELEKLNKGGPIAIADYCVQNEHELDELFEKIDNLLKRLNISL